MVTQRPFDVSAIARSLAFADALPALDRALDGDRGVVVAAPPGTGKTTLVPPVVANRVKCRVIVTQPRRVAARAAARRLASLDGSALGSRVGFTVRGERVIERSAVIEMVTPGVLLRRLLDDPGLDGVGAVVIDEVHERALDTDLLVALLGEVRELREDLTVVAMSATVEADRFAALLGSADDAAPVVAFEAEQHPLDVRWAPPAGPRLDERGVTRDFLRHVADTAAAAHRSLVRQDPAADSLVFAPGVREVSLIAESLRSQLPGVDVLELHGQVPPREQDRVIDGRAGADPSRVIVATSIAESSLTVPGVRQVIDAGLARVPRRDAARGMTGLVTEPASRAAAVQRAGRATRLGPGIVIRCVDERTFAAAPAHPTPEILTSDLTDAALLLAVWGAPSGAGLAFADAPPAEAMAAAVSTLRSLEAVDDDGRATAFGRRLVRVPADPRLARALIHGAEAVGARRAAEVVAALAGEVRATDGDLAATVRALRDGRHPQSRAWEREVQRFTRLADSSAQGSANADAVGRVVALAYPERVARRVSSGPDGAVFLLASGTRAGESGALAAEEWIAVADVTRAHARAAAGTGAVIRSAAPITEEIAESAAGGLVRDAVVATFVNGRVSARRERGIGAIVQSSVPVRARADEGGTDAVRHAIADAGLGLFAWSDEAVALRSRLALLHRELGAPWPDVSDAALLARLDEWLGTEIAQLADGGSVARVSLAPALRRLLPWPEAARFDELAPERLAVPSGSRIRVTYPPVDEPETQPVVAVKLQECFGLAASPRLVAGRVPVLFHLLSPAGRPLAVTGDLASFWSGPYAQVRAEMRGRYPKHPWPEDPWTAVATAKTSRRLAADGG